MATDIPKNTSDAFRETEKICANNNGQCVLKEDCLVSNILEHDMACLPFATHCVCCIKVIPGINGDYKLLSR